VPASSASFVRDPGRVRLLARQIAEGALSPVALLEQYLARIAEAEPHVQCWRELDDKRALALAEARAREAKAGRLLGPLHGIPIAVKDIIDVEGLPTRCNSRSRDAAAPAASDAEIVLALRRQGAIPLGKVHTTEFAFFDPSPARNPHNLAHTPGGSSSGSAAAVAAGMAPIAIGTQTVASVNRPAAYCGIAAFKPSTRALSTFGIAPLAPSYDTPGFYGYTVDDAVAAFEAVLPEFLPAPAGPPHRQLTIVVPEDHHLGDASVEVQTAMARTANKLSASGHNVVGRVSPISFAQLFLLQRKTMLYECGRALAHLRDAPAGSVGEKILAAVAEGQTIETAAYLEMRLEIDTMRTVLLDRIPEADLFLWPAAPSTAPEGLAWTGDPKYIAPWTAVGGPIVTMPVGKGANGLPLGCLLIGRPGMDRALCRWAPALAALAEDRR
jgi:aspartyl-tRNA(Asn)/glutamyl-tRNA(Gln) amidotransferase subunit A